MEAAPCRDREARPECVPCQLVAEADVRGSISSSCRRSGSSAAPAQPGITESSSDVLTRFGTTETSSTRRRAASSSRDARPSTAFATEGGRSAAVREASSSVDVEGVASGCGVHFARVVAGERRDRSLRQRCELEKDRVAGADGAHGRVQRMRRRHLAGPERQDEQRRQRADSPHEHGNRVERRVVGPVHVLEHEHRRRAAGARALRSADAGSRAARRPLKSASSTAAETVPTRSRIGPRGRGIRGRRRCRRAPAHRARDPARTG